VLYDDTWYDTILVDHVEIPDDLSIIEQALSHPDRVNFDAYHSNGENFYRQGLLQRVSSRRYLKVVVRFESTDLTPVGTVISAYGVPNYLRAGERRKWGTRGN
jgi:hypothetical protein